MHDGIYIMCYLYSYAVGGAIGFDGSDLIREAGGGIVAVEVQYRLGLFGTFLYVLH